MSKPTKDAKGNPVENGNVIQVTNPTHQWFPVLMIVEELKGWGVMAYHMVCSNGEEPNGQAYIRIPSEDFEVCGDAIIVSADDETEAE